MERPSVSDEDAVKGAMDVLRDIFTVGQNVPVPDPLDAACVRWGGDRHAFGSYSNISVGATGEDYDHLASTVGDRLFFAGEATNRMHPATMHGAFLSGVREAALISDALVKLDKRGTLRPPRLKSEEEEVGAGPKAEDLGNVASAAFPAAFPAASPPYAAPPLPFPPPPASYHPYLETILPALFSVGPLNYLSPSGELAVIFDPRCDPAVAGNSVISASMRARPSSLLRVIDVNAPFGMKATYFGVSRDVIAGLIAVEHGEEGRVARVAATLSVGVDADMSEEAKTTAIYIVETRGIDARKVKSVF